MEENKIREEIDQIKESMIKLIAHIELLQEMLYNKVEELKTVKK